MDFLEDYEQLLKDYVDLRKRWGADLADFHNPYHDVKKFEYCNENKCKGYREIIEKHGRDKNGRKDVQQV